MTMNLQREAKKKRANFTSIRFSDTIFGNKKWIIAETIIFGSCIQMNLLFFIIVLEGVDMPSPYWLSLRRIIKEAKSLTYKWVIGYFSEFHEIFARFYVKVDYFILSAEVICCKINTLNRKSNKKRRVVQRILGGSKNFCSQTLNPNATTTSPQGNLTTIKYWIWDTPTKFPEWHKGHGHERKGSILPFFVHIIDTKPGSYWMK